MTDRTIARFHDGRLWLDYGGQWEKSSRFAVVMKRAVMEELSGPDAARAVEECTKALEAYTDYQKETQCVAAKA